MIGFFIRLVGFAHRHALAVAVGFALLTAGLLYYTVTHLGIDTDTDKMLDARLPHVRQQHDFSAAFPQFSDVIVVVVDGTDAAQAGAAADAMATSLKARPDLFATVYQPLRGEFFERNGLLYLGEDELWKLNDRLTEAGPWLGRLSQDPSLTGLFGVLSAAVEQKLGPQQQKPLQQVMGRVAEVVEAQASGRVQSFSWREVMLGDEGGLAGNAREFVLAQPHLNFSDFQAGKAALDALHAVGRDLEQKPEYAGLNIRVTGSVAMEDEELASVSNGAEWSTVLSFLLVCVILVLGLRALRPVVAVLLTLLTGLIGTAAFAAFAVGSLNLISVSFAVLFIGLGVDFGIQFAMRYREELNLGAQTSEALGRAAAGVSGALLLAAVAAAACFFAFVPTSYRGLAELGLISGVGMFVALFANLTLLPALLTLLPVRPVSPRTTLSAAIQSWASSSRSHRPVLWGAAAVSALCLMVMPWVSFDFNPLNMRDPSTESVSTFYDLLRDSNTTPYTVDVMARDRASATALTKRLSELPAVDKAVTLDSYVISGQDEKLAILQDLSLVLGPGFTAPAAVPKHTHAERLKVVQALAAKLQAASGEPEFRATAARLARALEGLLAAKGNGPEVLDDLEVRLVGELPAGLAKLRKLLTASRFGFEDLPADLRERYIARDGRVRIQVFPKENLSDNQALRRFVQAVGSVTPAISGTPVALLEGGNAVVRACLQASGLALAAIFVVLIVSLRRLVDALLVLAPLALAAVLTVASAVLIGIPFDLANLIALPLMVGLGVAFSIYLVHRWRSGAALSDTMSSSTPQAIVYSALTTMVSFGALAFSQHRGMSGMGQLLTMALTYALLCTLLLLPALLRLREAQLRPG